MIQYYRSSQLEFAMNFRLVALVTGLAALLASIVFSLTILWVDGVVSDDAAHRAYTVYRQDMSDLRNGGMIAHTVSDPEYHEMMDNFARESSPTKPFVAKIPLVLGLGIFLAVLGMCCFLRKPSKFCFRDHKEDPFRFAEEFREAIR
jgi:hypothetical protein